MLANGLSCERPESALTTPAPYSNPLQGSSKSSNSGTITIEEAKSHFTNSALNSSKSARKSDENKYERNVDWKLAEKVRESNGLELVVVPITYKSGRKPGKLIWSDKTPENEKLAKIDNVLEIKEKLISYKDTSGQMHTEILQLIPSKEYKTKKKENISKNDFSGWIMALTWDEDFITGFEFKNGKRIRDLLNPSKTRGGRTSCEVYYSSQVTSYCHPCSGGGACTECDVYITGQYITTCTMPSSDSGTNSNYGPTYGGSGWYFASQTYYEEYNTDLKCASFVFTQTAKNLLLYLDLAEGIVINHFIISQQHI
jgi:hypothetical protein